MPSPSSFSRFSPSSFGRCSPPLFSKNTYEEVLKEYNIKEYSAIEFRGITFSDEKSSLENSIVRKLEHHKEAWSHSDWEHEFLVAEMYHPGNSEIAGVLVIDRENRRNTPDIVRAIPADALRSTPLPHILSRLGYHPSNLGRSREFDSPPSVGEIASVLADMSQVGGDYSSTDKNCYWYANAVFDHCWLAYGGRITIGPYYDDLGRFRGVAPRNVIRQRIITGVRYTSLTVLGAGLGGASIPLAAGGIAIIAASFLIKRSKMFQAAPLLS